MKSLLKKAHVFQKIRMKKGNNLIIQCNHVILLIQKLYLRPRNDQLGLKLPYKKKKDSRPQLGPSKKVRSPKDSPAMQYT
jgi:hypothetical protein